MRQDFRFALRMIASHRWFSAAVVVTLALGIGLNTMVFTLINAVLFKPVPVPGGERLIAVMCRPLGPVDRNRRRMPVSYPDFRDYRAHASSMDALEAAAWDEAVLSEQGNPPRHYNMMRVSTGLFGMLHIPPVQGRDFVPDDQKPGAPPVVLLSYGVWKERYGRAHVAGRVVRVNSKPATIIGVMPEGFKFPSEQEMWMPIDPTPELEDRSHRSLQLFGMLKPGIGIAQANADFDVIAHRLATEYPKTNKDTGAKVETFHERYNGDEIAIVFTLMMAAVGFVLLIACANVANMMLGRALGRQREISIRAAMGASRWQIVRQLLIESMLLSLLGGTAGLGLAALGVHGFDLATQDVGKPYWIEFTMEYTVFAYFAVICVLSALMFGLVPALRSSRVDVISAMKDGVRSAGTQRGGRLSGILVVFQFALTLVLLMGASVFMRSFVEKQKINSWIPAEHIMTARLNLPKEGYADAAARQRFFDKLLPKLAALPGVTDAAMTSNTPGTGSGSRPIEIEGSSVKDTAHRPSASVVVESPGYCRTLGLPILRGRDFNLADGDTSRRAALVTHEFAARYWPKGDAVGKRYRFYNGAKPGDWMEVVGITGDMVQHTFESAPDPLVFVPYRQDSDESMTLLIRTTGNPSSLAGSIRAVVQNLDRDLPLFDLRTLSDEFAREIWALRLFGTIFLAFSLIALLMASVGIYAVMAQSTGSRTQEIGVRMALGATSAGIVRLVLKRGMVQLIAGLGLGLLAAFPVSKVMASLPFLVSPSDPFLLVIVGLLLATVGLFACWLPARRAAALHPVSAIRNE